MHRFALAALILALTLSGGCGPSKPDDTGPRDLGPAEPSATAAARARYAALPGALVGEVEDVAEPFAAVSGIDASAVKPDEVLHFIDPIDDGAVAQGFVQPGAGTGRIIVKYIVNRRPPQKGDVVVRLK